MGIWTSLAVVSCESPKLVAPPMADGGGMSNATVISGWPPELVSLNVTGEANCGLKMDAWAIWSPPNPPMISAKARTRATPVRFGIIVSLPLGS